MSAASSVDGFDIEARIGRALASVDRLKGTKYAAARASQTTNDDSRSTLIHGGDSRLFLDSADVNDWAKYLGLGIFYGVTTNPVLLQRAGVACTIEAVGALAKVALEEYCCKEFMIQAWGGETSALVSTGEAIAALDAGRNRIVVKVPLTADGIKAARILGRAGVRICMTACYNKEQAFVAAGLGAEYVAPYLGRMSENGKDGLAECAEMQRIVSGMGATTRIFVASLRSPVQLTTLAAEGCNTFTFSPSIADMLLHEPLTAAAAADFENAAKAMGGSLV